MAQATTPAQHRFDHGFVAVEPLGDGTVRPLRHLHRVGAVHRLLPVGAPLANQARTYAVLMHKLERSGRSLSESPPLRSSGHLAFFLARSRWGSGLPPCAELVGAATDRQPAC